MTKLRPSSVFLFGLPINRQKRLWRRPELPQGRRGQAEGRCGQDVGHHEGHARAGRAHGQLHDGFKRPGRHHR